MEEKNINQEDDMSNTFVKEINQKSAIADNDVEVLEENGVNDNSSVFEEVKIDPPGDSIGVVTDDVANNNLNNTTVISDAPVIPIEQHQKIEQNNVPINDNSNGNNKKTSPILIIILILISLIIGAGGSYYYFEILHKVAESESNVTKTTTKEKTTVEDQELNPDGIYVKNLIDRYDFFVISNVEVYDDLYGKEKTLAAELDENYIRTVAASSIKSNLIDTSFSSSALKDSVTRLFGNQINLEDKSFKVECENYEYNQSTGYYNHTEGAGCGGASDLKLQRKIIKAIKTKDNIVVDVAVAILSGSNQKVYKNYKKGDISDSDLQEVEGVSADTFDIDKDYDKLNKYQYKFNYDSDNNNYYLYSIELVK